MANKKKTRKKATKSKRAAGKKLARLKQRAKKGSAAKKSAKKKSATKKAGAKKKALGKKAIRGKTVAARNKRNRRKSQRQNVVTFSRKESGSRSGEQSGDLQGLSNVEGADSESVQELLEEGNAFEAEVVKGVEDAGDRSGTREVRTHEVPEDDVPSEYLDKD
jgi:hypothetical protein